MKRTPKQAFTLVELLVVIGIIALLISMLLPALNRARQSAQDVACLSNMRQIGLAAQMYIQQHKGTFPIHVEWTGDHFAVWDRLLAPYLGMEGVSLTGNSSNPPTQRAEVLICPRDTSLEPPAGFFKRSYTMNGVRDSGTARPQDGVVLRRNPWQNDVPAPKITNVKEPAETIFMFENFSPIADGVTLARHNAQWFVGYGASIGFLGAPTNLYANGDVPHHGKRMAVLFVDGHSSLEDPWSFYTSSTVNLWDRGR